MSRLTKSIRESMARKLVAHRYTDEAKELVRTNRTLAERSYKHCYSKKIADAMDLIEKEFSNTFSMVDSIRVNAGGYSVDVGGYMRNNWVKVEQVKPVEYRTIGRYTMHDISGDEKLMTDIKNFAIKSKGFNDACQTAYAEAMSVLQTMTSGKKLAAAWPEAMAVIGDLIPEDERTLPVVQVSAINAKFRLPPEKHNK